MRTTGSVTSDILPAVPRGAPVDGFRLAYESTGSGPPASRLHVLEGVGHFVALQAPDEVAAAIRAATGTSA